MAVFQWCRIRPRKNQRIIIGYSRTGVVQGPQRPSHSGTDHVDQHGLERGMERIVGTRKGPIVGVRNREVCPLRANPCLDLAKTRIRISICATATHHQHEQVCRMMGTYIP